MVSIDNLFAAQKAAFRSNPAPDYQQRRDDLRALKRLLADNQDAIVDAICSDYGNRSRHETLFAELIPALDGIAHCLHHLRGWMKPRPRAADQTLFPGASNRVIPQPLGVVGLILPWNFPINLAFLQLACALSAGNHVLAKMSENSRALSRLLIEVSPRYFPPEKLSFIEETGEVGIAFSQLPLDLIIFTGSGETGRKVMASAAQNLTPVILELGGKTPAVIDARYPLKKAVERIMYAKQFNAGQICTTVDYVFVDAARKDRFIELVRQWVREHVPDIHGPDYTSIIDDRAYTRLVDTLEDARSKGATIINLCGDQQANAETRKMPLHLVLDTTPEMQIRQRETFGPLLMVLAYTDPQEVIDHVNEGGTPLALYPFSNDKALVQRYIDAIPTGGVTVNDTLLHVIQHDLPFGGLGESGMGHYHGAEGFEACSKMLPVFHQARFSALKFLAPPYGKFATRVLNLLTRLKS